MRIEVRRCTASTASSSARSAIPAYTEPISSRKFAKIPKTNGSAFGPTGRMRATRSAGTTAPSSTVDWLCVARMPRVSQSSSAFQPGVSRVMKPWMSWSPCRPKMPSRVHAGLSDVKIFVPVNAHPSPTGSAVVRESQSTRSLPASLLPKAKSSPAAASASTHSSEGSPRSASTRATPVQTRCMLIPSAVAGAYAASNRWSRAVSSSGRGARYPASRSSSRSSVKNALSRS